jgi:hypothetical protein
MISNGIPALNGTLPDTATSSGLSKPSSVSNHSADFTIHGDLFYGSFLSLLRLNEGMEMDFTALAMTAIEMSKKAMAVAPYAALLAAARVRQVARYSVELCDGDAPAAQHYAFQPAAPESAAAAEQLASTDGADTELASIAETLPETLGALPVLDELQDMADTTPSNGASPSTLDYDLLMMVFADTFERSVNDNGALDEQALDEDAVQYAA